MRAAGARLRTLPAAALVASGCSLTPVPGCDQLHTQEFFAWADTPRVTSCLRQGADVTAHDPDGNTALHWAARYTDRPAIVTALVKAGADLDARTTADSSTALHLAARYSDHPAVIAALASAGAPLETRNENGATPLHSAAAYNQNPAIITALATAGADMEARNRLERTPLHSAADGDYPAIVAALLEAGAEVNPTDRFGRTPLDRARHPDIIALLLEAGGVCARSDVCEESPGASMR